MIVLMNSFAYWTWEKFSKEMPDSRGKRWLTFSFDDSQHVKQTSCKICFEGKIPKIEMLRTIAVDDLAVCAMLLLVSTVQTMGNSLDSNRVALWVSFAVVLLKEECCRGVGT
jgi:hypothetical protein